MSTPGFESSQNQTRKQATMIPTVTTGKRFVGTLSRSGSTALENTLPTDLTPVHSGFILVHASGSNERRFKEDSMATLVRWAPFSELASLQNEMSRFMNGLVEG